MLDIRPLGDSPLRVSALSLGSWRTLERLPRPIGPEIMTAARESGITFLDDARYDDETGTAPMRTGYSEVVFGQLLRDSAWPREQVVIANKLWWEFWPDQTAVQELDGSLLRMGLDHVDLIYSSTLPAEVSVAEAVESAARLIETGRALAWAVVNWPAPQIGEALDYSAAHGLPAPCAAQLPYSLLRRDVVDDPAMQAALERGLSLVPSAILAGGALTGRYAGSGAARGRLADADPATSAPLRAGIAVARFAEQAGVTELALALAFADRHPATASLLLGTSSAEQVSGLVQAYAAAGSIDDDTLERGVAVVAAAVGTA
jgi:aryl-alcohol dehydrogenase-like predicted oxidoreductase